MKCPNCQVGSDGGCPGLSELRFFLPEHRRGVWTDAGGQGGADGSGRGIVSSPGRAGFAEGNLRGLLDSSPSSGFTSCSCPWPRMISMSKYAFWIFNGATFCSDLAQGRA